MHKLREVISARAGAVAAAHQEEVPDGAGLYRVHHLTGDAQDGIVAKAGCHGAAAVDAGKVLRRLIAAQGKRLLDEGREVLLCINVGDAGVGHHIGGEHPVYIVILGRHQAVGGKENGGGEIGKFLLLVLPGRAEITLEMGVLPKFRIPVGGEHLAVSVDVDACPFGCFQQQLEIQQIMAGDHDEGTRLHGEGDRGGCGRTEGLGVGAIQELHAGEVIFAHLHHNGEKLLHAPVLAHREERLGDKAVEGIVHIPQRHGVVGIGGHAADAKEDQRLEAANVLVGVPELTKIIVAGAPAGLAAAGAALRQGIPFAVHPIHQRF